MPRIITSLLCILLLITLTACYSEFGQGTDEPIVRATPSPTAPAPEISPTPATAEPQHTPTHEPAEVSMTPSPTTEILATMLALPPGPDVETSRIILQAFFDAYNHHDVRGVLATLNEAFVYGDCDFAKREMQVIEEQAELIAWLEAKFAEQDQFAVEDVIIAPAEGSPPNDPRSTAVQVLRTNLSLQAVGEEREALFKIVLNPDGNRIQYLNAYGNVDCEAGK